MPESASCRLVHARPPTICRPMFGGFNRRQAEAGSGAGCSQAGEAQRNSAVRSRSRPARGVGRLPSPAPAWARVITRLACLERVVLGPRAAG